MNTSLPKEKLILLCDNGYIVKQVLYSDIIFDPQEIEHKSLISVAELESFDAVLQLVSDLRRQGHVFNCEIGLTLGNENYRFYFSGTSINDEIVLTAYVANRPNHASLYPKSKSHNQTHKLHQLPEDVMLMEELNQLSKQFLNNADN